MNHRIVAVAAIGAGKQYSGALGKDEKLLWHIPDDLKRFKTLTMGHPVIFGRKTFESIVAMLGKPLPGRTSIVVSRDPAYLQTIVARGLTGVLVASSIAEAIDLAKAQPGGEEIHIGGGAQIYEQALPFIDKLYLTLVEDSKEADTFFPQYEHLFTKKIFEESREWNGLHYRWVDLER